MFQNLKQKIKNRLLSYLFNAATEEDFLKIMVRKGNLKNEQFYGIMVGERVLEEQEVRGLVMEAQAIQRMKLPKLIRKSLEAHSNKKIFKDSATTDQLNFPKATLYALDVIYKKYENIAKIDR